MPTLLSRRAALFALAPSLQVRTNFPGGNIGKIEAISSKYLRVHVLGQSDQDGRNRQANWYYFEVSGAVPGQEIQIDLVDLPGEYNYQPNRGAVTGDTRPHLRLDKSWLPCPGDYDPNEPKWTLRVRPTRSTFRIAHIVPYTSEHLLSLRRAVRPQVEVIGRSVEGRPLELWTFHGSLPPSAPTVWLMFRQHAWEAGTSWVADGMLRQLPRNIRWKVLPLNDPDGVEHGGVRFNRHGYDLNRNWDSPEDLRLRPEIAYQRRAIEAWKQGGGRIDLFLTLHNTETSEYLEGPPGDPGQRLFGELKKRSRFAPTRDYFTRMEWDKPSRANVIQYLWASHKIPACLMELKVAGVDAAEWPKFGPELASAIERSLSD